MSLFIQNLKKCSFSIFQDPRGGSWFSSSSCFYEVVPYICLDSAFVVLFLVMIVHVGHGGFLLLYVRQTDPWSSYFARQILIHYVPWGWSLLCSGKRIPAWLISLCCILLLSRCCLSKCITFLVKFVALLIFILCFNLLLSFDCSRKLLQMTRVGLSIFT